MSPNSIPFYVRIIFHCAHMHHVLLTYLPTLGLVAVVNKIIPHDGHVDTHSSSCFQFFWIDAKVQKF